MTVACNLAGFDIGVGIAFFYIAITILYFFAFVPGEDSMSHFFNLTQQIFILPTTISFPEILLADAFTSLSKVFKDFGVTVVVVYSKAIGMNPVENHDFGMLLVAVLASLPFL